MGILNSYRKQQREEKKSDAGEEKKRPAKKNNSKDRPAERPMVCLDCWSPSFWRSIYGGALRCAVCNPWPSAALIGERWTLATLPGGSIDWESDDASGERAEALAGCEVEDEEGGVVRVLELEDDEGQWLRLRRGK